MTFDVAADLPEQDEYEVRVYDIQRLVAAVEIISPANNDRPEHRRVCVAKCAGLLQRQVSVALVELVTTRQFNLYVDLLEVIGQADPSLGPVPPVVYAAACRWTREGDAWHFRAWTHTLAVGQPVPTLPPWLADNLAVPWSWKRAARRPAASCASRNATLRPSPGDLGFEPRLTKPDSFEPQPWAADSPHRALYDAE